MTCKDYEKLLEFSYFINKDYANFIPNVLQAMSEICEYPLNAYSVCTKSETFDFMGTVDSNLIVERVHSNAVYTDFLEAYRQELYKSDLFHQRFRIAKHGKSVLTIPDVSTYEEFYATEYGQYLCNINFPYQANMSGYTQPPLHTLCVYKTREQGEFTQDELAFLERIGRAFQFAVRLYKQFLANSAFSSFLELTVEESGRNLAIIDDCNSIVYCSRMFLSVLSSVFGVSGEFAAVKALQMAFQSVLHSAQPGQPLAKQFGGYWIQISSKFVFTGECMQKYQFVVLEENFSHQEGRPPVKKKQYMADGYGLSVREAEIAELMVDGLDNGQIAEMLFLSLSTVKFHMRNIYKKVGATKRSVAITKLLK